MDDRYREMGIEIGEIYDVRPSSVAGKRGRSADYLRVGRRGPEQNCNDYYEGQAKSRHRVILSSKKLVVVSLELLA